MNVSNRKCVRRLSIRGMRAAKSRNLIAVLAIALTTVLFTTLFTIALSINHSIQQANFRQVGGYAHGTFKYLTLEQADELRDDPLIQEHGLRRFVGMPHSVPFNKAHVEVGYSDANNAKWQFIKPIEGRLPAEGTNEAATDTRVLSLLGVEPRLGAEFTMTFDVDGVETSETFTLCGWWAYDNAIVASHVLLPQSRAESIFEKLGTQGEDGMTGFWNLDAMFRNSMNIERDVNTVLKNHGFQGENIYEDNYIATGVNWGYTGAQLEGTIDPMTVLAIAALLLVIVFTGYLIIYNVFQISVSGDIRFYGLLKTIGVTGRQLARMIRIQALSLSVLGIPVGLLLGYFVGMWLTPAVLARLNGVVVDAVSASPLIFLLSALFSLVTVLISCRKPGRMAAKVSPVEAVRYVEGGSGKKDLRKGLIGASLPKMAWANLGRSRRKTSVTILSLSLAVLLLNLTVTFTKGFDMDKYLRRMASDFVLADAGYFQVGNGLWSADRAVGEDVIESVREQGGITAGGRTYALTSSVQEFVSEERFRSVYGAWYPPEKLDDVVESREKLDDRIADNAQLYGMERFVLGRLSVVEGDISKLYEPGGRYIAAVYYQDDYGTVRMDSHWAQVGDTISLRYMDEWEYYHPETGEVYENGWAGDMPWARRAKAYRDVEYEVAALVSVPYALSYRYSASDEFVLNDQTFIQDTGTDAVMYYAFNTPDEANPDMEAFLRDFTENRQPGYDYESKQTFAAEFESFRGMFTMLGGVLCFIIGLVGVLNFLNAVLTGILTRRREFAVLQSIGMTGRQLKAMLIWEGVYYTLGSVLASLLLCIATAPLLSSALGNLFWFFTYRFTLAPVLVVAPVFALLGVVLPLASYRFAAKRTIVERLREVEG